MLTQLVSQKLSSECASGVILMASERANVNSNEIFDSFRAPYLTGDQSKGCKGVPGMHYSVTNDAPRRDHGPGTGEY